VVLYSVKQAAQKLACSVALVYQLCSKRLLRHVRIGVGRGKIVIPEEAIAEYLKGREFDPIEPKPPSETKMGMPLRHREDGFIFLPPKRS
jgi:excisionase family DNA binding protein